MQKNNDFFCESWYNNIGDVEMEKIYIKNKKLFKNKTEMIIYLILFVLLLYGFIYFGKKDYEVKISDSEKFSADFNMVASDNIYKYVNATDVRMIAHGKKGIVLFGTTNEWVNYYAYMVNKVAKEVGISEIYYYDFLKNRTDNNGTYEDIVNSLSDYVTVNDRGKKEIYAPSLLVVSNDKILLFDSETSFVSGNITPSDYWKDKELEKEELLRKVFLEYLG